MCVLEGIDQQIRISQVSTASQGPHGRATNLRVVVRNQLTDAVDLADLTEADAGAAGFADLDELVAVLSKKKEGSVYRVEVRFAGPDPRAALRTALPNADELRGMLERLARWDQASPVGPWTRAAMDMIERRPATLAAELASDIGMEKPRFKTNVRKLKGLGLTESLKVGYRLSPRGEEVRAALGALEGDAD